MKILRRFLVRVRNLLSRQNDALRLREEMQEHLLRQTEENMRAGMPPDEARRQAAMKFGAAATIQEQYHAETSLPLFESTLHDLRYAVRILRKSPGFTAIAVGSLAVGIGANTAIFTAAQHMLLDRLNVSHPDQLRMFYWTQPKEGIVSSMWGSWDDMPDGGLISTSFSYPVYQQMRQANRSLADVFAFKPYGRMTVTIGGNAEAAETEMVSGNYYTTLGVRPQLGRGIQESDDGDVGSGPVVTISDRLWTNRFGRSPNAIGKTVLINAQPMTVVGVNPPGFTGANSAQGTPDIFLPISMQPIVAPDGSDTPSLLTNKSLWWVLMMGRIKPGVSSETAQASLNVALNTAVRATMDVKTDKQLPRLVLRDGSRGQNPSVEGFAKPIVVLMSLAGLVLLLACANLANLLLARAGVRQREMSVRLAMGAGRARLLRQMMTESLLLSFLGGASGLLLAWMARNTIPRLLSNAWDPPAFSARLSWPIFAFAAAVSILTGIVFGLAPAWKSTRVEVSSGLKESGQTVTRRRRGLGGKAIVAVQVALSMLLVIGAGLFVRTLMQLGRSPLGFHSHNLLLFSVDLPETRYPKAASTPALQRLEEKFASVPGVQAEALTEIPLISGSARNSTLIPEGQQRKAEGNPSALTNRVGARFFETFGIPIFAGRAFTTQQDTANSPKVAVVNQSLAQKFFPNANPIGKTFQTGGRHPFTVEIVGVCGDARYYRVRKEVQPTFYTPYWQVDEGVHSATFAISTQLDGHALLPSLRDAIQQIDTNLPMLDVRTQDEQIAANLRQERIFAVLSSGFGVLALALACVGIYGIMAYSVANRRNEIGIRLALGAQPRQVRAMILRESTWLSVAGIVAGVGTALFLTRLVKSMLYGIQPNDPLTIAGGVLLLLAVALAASWIPARRAARVQPMEALRHE